MRAWREGGGVRRRWGASAVEFALTLPVFFLLLSGILDVGWYISQQHVVTQAARDSLRWSVRSSRNPHQAALLARDAGRAWLIAGGVPCDEGCKIDADAVTIRGYHGVDLRVSVPITPMMGVLMPHQQVEVRYAMLLDRQ